MGYIVINVTVRTWRQKKHIVVAMCERALNAYIYTYIMMLWIIIEMTDNCI